MLSIKQLNNQNENIKELSGVLEYLIKNKEMCSSKVTCDLFLNYAKEVNDHLQLEEKDVYSPLLNHDDLQIRNTVVDFFNGSLEIKRIFNTYLTTWCKNETLRVRKHDEFVQETREIFGLVSNRLNAESTILYPTVIDALSDQVAA